MSEPPITAMTRAWKCRMRPSEASDHRRQTVVRTGNLQPRTPVRSPTSRVRSQSGSPRGRRGVTTVARRWFGRGTSNLARQCDPLPRECDPRAVRPRPARSDHRRQTVVRTGNLQPRTPVRSRAARQWDRARDRADARGLRTSSPTKPRTHVHGRPHRAPSHNQMIRSIQRSVLSISFRKMPIASLSRWYSAISKSSSLLFLLSSL